MGFLTKSRERLRLRSLRHKVIETQSLPLLIELLKSYIAIGDAQDALEMSEWGLKLFPDSQAVREIHHFSSREHDSEVRKRAPEQSQPKVGPEPLLDLARTQLAGGKDEDAERTLERCVAEFPEHAKAHAELGEIAAQRFRADLCSSDALRSIQCYERAIAADPRDGRTKFALAALLVRIGALARARELLKGIIEHDREHAVAASLLDAMGRMTSEEEGETLESLLVKIEQRGQLAHDYPPEEMVGKQLRSDSIDLIERLVESLKDETCVDEVVFIDADGKHHGKPGPLGEMCRELLPTAAMAMRRMQFGAMLSFIVETDQRQIQVQKVPDGNVAMRTAPGVARSKAALVLRRHLESYAGWRKS